MNSIIRAMVGGACIGTGIAIGAYSGGWFLLLAVALGVLGIGMLVGAVDRSTPAVAGGDPVPVRIDHLDRSAPGLGGAATLVSGEARPEGDVPFRFQTEANLSPAQLADLVADGRGALPAGALGTPGDVPVTEHRTGSRVHVPAVLAAGAAMWAALLVPPSDVWDLRPFTPDTTAAAPVTDLAPDERPLWQWYDDVMAHLRTEAPDALQSLLGISVYDTFVEAEVYLGGDRVRVYEGRTDGWETSETTTSKRTRDVFTAAELQGFSAQDFLTRAAGALPETSRRPNRLEVSRDSDDIVGATRPVLATAMFGENPSIPVQAKPDGTVAAWWATGDLAAGLRQIGEALTARGFSLDDQHLREITLGTSSDAASFELEYYRGATYYLLRGSAGAFSAPDDEMSDSESPRFRFTDIDPAVLTNVRDDAMVRFGIDPVDRGAAEITIGHSDSADNPRADDAVIAVDYRNAHGGTAIYTMAGEFLAETSN